MDGDLFREARERAGLSLAELAQVLDVRGEYLQALERGELGRLLGPSYMQSIAVRYAAAVGLDPEKVLAAGSEEPRPSSSSPDVRGPGRKRENGRPPRGRLSLRRYVVLALVFVGVVAMVVVVLQSMSVLSLGEAIGGSAGRSATTTTVSAAASTTTTFAATTTTTIVATTTTVAQTTTTTDAARFTVVFAPSADVWLEITDQKTGKAVYSGLRKSGERLKLQFTGPAKVVVGRPEVIKVSLNGVVVKTPTVLVWRLSSAGIAAAQ